MRKSQQLMERIFDKLSMSDGSIDGDVRSVESATAAIEAYMVSMCDDLFTIGDSLVSRDNRKVLIEKYLKNIE